MYEHKLENIRKKLDKQDWNVDAEDNGSKNSMENEENEKMMVADNKLNCMNVMEDV